MAYNLIRCQECQLNFTYLTPQSTPGYTPLQVKNFFDWAIESQVYF